MSAASFQAELEPFRIDVHGDGAEARVVPIGEVDVATVGRIDERLHELRQAGLRRFVLDLRQVRFMDSNGLRVILSWDARCRREGIGFVLIEGSPEVQRVFEVVGVTGQLQFRPR